MDMQFVHFKCLCVQPANQSTDMTSKRSARKHLKSPSQSIQLDIVYFFIACNCLGQNLYIVRFLQFVKVFTLIIFLVADTQLYKRLCPSLRLSVGSGHRVEKWGKERFRYFLCMLECWGWVGV